MPILCREPSEHLVSLEICVKERFFEIISGGLKTECALILNFGAQELAASPFTSSGRARRTRSIPHVHPRPPLHTLHP